MLHSGLCNPSPLQAGLNCSPEKPTRGLDPPLIRYNQHNVSCCMRSYRGSMCLSHERRGMTREGMNEHEHSVCNSLRVRETHLKTFRKDREHALRFCRRLHFGVLGRNRRARGKTVRHHEQRRRCGPNVPRWHVPIRNRKNFKKSYKSSMYINIERKEERFTFPAPLLVPRSSARTYVVFEHE